MPTVAYCGLVQLPDDPWPELICDSYLDQVGEELCEPHDLYNSPAVVLCHDTSADPLFVYANLAAQHLWRREWRDFIGWPSRLTAPTATQAQRAAALNTTAVVSGYEGTRIDSYGQSFTIHNATVWSVFIAGIRVGQAATFTEWSLPLCADVTRGGPVG